MSTVQKPPIPLDIQNLPSQTIKNEPTIQPPPQVFNPLTHIPPKYTIDGFLKPFQKVVTQQISFH